MLVCSHNTTIVFRMFGFDCSEEKKTVAQHNIDLSPIGIALPAGKGSVLQRYQRLQEEPAVSSGSFFHNCVAGLLHPEDASYRSALNSAGHLCDIPLMTLKQQMWLADLSNPASARAMLQLAGHVG
jgi:hypothetical protein